MNKLAIVLIAIGLIALIFGGAIALMYNSLVSANIAVDQSWSEVNNQYQRQYDLIPNLVNTARGYMAFESSLLQNITNARTQWLNSMSQSIDNKIQAGVQLNAITGQLLATVEAYPNIKSDAIILQLMDDLSGTQNRITVARGRFIEATGNYNTAVRSFPTNIVASMFGYYPKDYYQAEQQALQHLNVTVYP